MATWREEGPPRGATAQSAWQQVGSHSSARTTLWRGRGVCETQDAPMRWSLSRARCRALRSGIISVGRWLCERGGRARSTCRPAAISGGGAEVLQYADNTTAPHDKGFTTALLCRRLASWSSLVRCLLLLFITPSSLLSPLANISLLPVPHRGPLRCLRREHVALRCPLLSPRTRLTTQSGCCRPPRTGTPPRSCAWRTTARSAPAAPPCSPASWQT